MGWLSKGGSVFDDYIGVISGGGINPGAGKDAKRAAEKKEAGLRTEADRLRTQGLAKGDEEFEKIYGQKKEQVGIDMQDIIKRRRDSLNNSTTDPIANQVRQSGNDAQRNLNSNLAATGVKGGAGAQAKNSVNRQATRDVNSQLAQKYMSDLNSMQSITGNLATQSQRLPQAYAQLFVGGQFIPPVGQAPFLGGMLDHGPLGDSMGSTHFG